MSGKKARSVGVVLATALAVCATVSANSVWHRRGSSPANDSVRSGTRANAAPGPKESDAQIIRDLRSYLKQLVAENRFSGSVLVAKHGRVLFEHSYGYADKAFDVPNKIDTKFNLGSMGKMFTGVSILQLVQEGKISLDDKLIKDLPDYPNKKVANEITIFQLLTHTSGLGDFFGPKFAHSSMEKFQSLESLLPLFVNKPLLFEPGTKWSYSNAGFIVLGLVIQHVTGESYYKYVRDHVFKPAGMINTGNWRSDAVVPNQAMGYTSMPPGMMMRRGMPHPLKKRRMNIFSLQRGGSAGGGYSTVVDLWHFSEALQHYKLLDKKYTEMDMTGHVPTGRAHTKYGFGMEESIVDGVRVVGHGGGGQGINSMLQMYPGLGYTVAVMTNYDPPTAQIVTTRLEWDLTGKPLPHAIHLSRAALDALTGKYAVAPMPGMRRRRGMRLPPIEVRATARGLTVQIGPQVHRFLPLSATEFFDEDMLSPRLTFTKNAQGQITGFTLKGAGPEEMKATRLPYHDQDRRQGGIDRMRGSGGDRAAVSSAVRNRPAFEPRVRTSPRYPRILSREIFDGSSVRRRRRGISGCFERAQ